MPIISTDIKFRLSGGAANSVGSAALGGAVSSTDASSTLNALFPYVPGTESSAGGTDYLCIYVKNNHATLTLYNAHIWISSNTPSTYTTLDIGLGTSAINGTEQTVANMNTAPTSVTFSSAVDEAHCLTIGDMAAGATKAVWVRRTVTAGATAYNADTATLTVKGDTGA